MPKTAQNSLEKVFTCIIAFDLLTPLCGQRLPSSGNWKFRAVMYHIQMQGKTLTHGAPVVF